MKLHRYQNGSSLFSIVFTLLLIGFVAYTALKLFPVYMEDFSISSSLETLEAESAKEYRGALSVREAVMRRFNVNNVSRVGKDDISITREGQSYYVDVDYEVTIPFIGNVSLLLKFSHSASVRASI